MAHNAYGRQVPSVQPLDGLGQSAMVVQDFVHTVTWPKFLH